jgi:L-talarate/galactarate dehydratase
VQHARDHIDRGFRQMKYRMGGIHDVMTAVERTRVLREAVGPDVDLLVDSNWSWTVNETIEMARALAPYRLFWLEDPIPADDYDGLRDVNAAIETPIAAGETYYVASEFHAALGRRALDYVIIDLEVGGITQMLKMAALAESYGLKVASHTCTEIGTHVIAAIPNRLTVEYLPWAQLIFKSVPPIVEGKLVLGEEPGLGLELDEAALERFALA